jgi:hypothetical protein
LFFHGFPWLLFFRDTERNLMMSSRKAVESGEPAIPREAFFSIGDARSVALLASAKRKKGSQFPCFPREKFACNQGLAARALIRAASHSPGRSGSGGLGKLKIHPELCKSDI